MYLCFNIFVMYHYMNAYLPENDSDYRHFVFPFKNINIVEGHRFLLTVFNSFHFFTYIKMCCSILNRFKKKVKLFKSHEWDEIKAIFLENLHHHHHHYIFIILSQAIKAWNGIEIACKRNRNRKLVYQTSKKYNDSKWK